MKLKWEAKASESSMHGGICVERVCWQAAGNYLFIWHCIWGFINYRCCYFLPCYAKLPGNIAYLADCLHCSVFSVD